MCGLVNKERSRQDVLFLDRRILLLRRKEKRFRFVFVMLKNNRRKSGREGGASGVK